MPRKTSSSLVFIIISLILIAYIITYVNPMSVVPENQDETITKTIGANIYADFVNLKKSFYASRTNADVIVYKEGNYAVAYNTNTKKIIAKSTDHTSVLKAAILSDDAKFILIKSGIYYIDGITISQPLYKYIYGEGIDTILVVKSNSLYGIKINQTIGRIIIANMRIRGQGESAGQAGIIIRDASEVLIDNINFDYLQYPIYINSQHGNVIVLRNVEISSSGNGIVFNGANQIYIYDPNIHLSTRDGTTAFLFMPLFGDEQKQAQNIKIYGGHVFNVEHVFRWPTKTEGLRVDVYGTEFENFINLVTVETNQAGNLYIAFYSIIVFSNGITKTILNGVNLTEESLMAEFYSCTWIGGVDPEFVFSNQPLWYINYRIIGKHKFASGFPVVRTSNCGKAVFSGDGVTTQFTIAHGIGRLLKKVIVIPCSADASGDFYVTADSNYIYVNYVTAPPAGTDNVCLYWEASIG